MSPTQDMARSNIRLANSSKPVDVTVLDQRTALELAEKFPGCRVERYPEHLIPEHRPRRHQPGPAPSGHSDEQHWTVAQITRSAARQTTGDQA